MDETMSSAQYIFSVPNLCIPKYILYSKMIGLKYF